MWAMASPPVGPDQVDAVELGEVVGAGLPVLGEFGLRAPVEVADVLDRHPVATISARGARDVRLPVAVVARLQGRVPTGDREGGHNRRGPRQPFRTPDQHRGCARDRDHAHHGREGAAPKAGIAATYGRRAVAATAPSPRRHRARRTRRSVRKVTFSAQSIIWDDLFAPAPATPRLGRVCKAHSQSRIMPMVSMAR